MKISTRISILLLLIVLVSGLLNLFLIRHQSTALHEASEEVFSKTITQSLSTTIIQDIINGNTLRVSNQLHDLVQDNNPIVFLFVTKNGRVVAHSFKKGFPRYLKNQDLSLSVSGVKLRNKYQTEDFLINEYVSSILHGMDIQLHVGINQSDFIAQLVKVTRNILFASFSILILSLLVVYFWTGSFVRPLASLSRLIEEYGEGRRVNMSHFQVGADQEINDLGHIFRKAIEQRDIAESELVRQASHDALTGLPNRFLTNDRLQQQLKKADRDGSFVAVVFIDLDDFKKINDSLGHDIGDKLLIEVSFRLQKVLRAEDTIGRQGGDEFIGVFGSLNSPSDANLIAESIKGLFTEPFHIDDSQFRVTGSLGIAIYPDDGMEAGELLKNADLAMYHSKSLGPNNYSFHSVAMSKTIQRRIALEAWMIGGFSNNEFTVFYQPKVDVKTGEVLGMEALLRWFSPELGAVSPEEFIGVAEHTGFIEQLGLFVFKEAVGTLAELNRKLAKPISIAVNLSPIQFRNSGFVDNLQNVIEHEGVDASLIELEITENVLLNENQSVVEVLKSVTDLGMKISMDDFGTGYSSLSYLQKYPFDVIKIDQLFVMNMLNSSKERELVNAIILMAHALDLHVVAEGVETEDQLTLLKQMQCDIAQGYLMSKPIPKHELIKFLGI